MKAIELVNTSDNSERKVTGRVSWGFGGGYSTDGLVQKNGKSNDAIVMIGRRPNFSTRGCSTLVYHYLRVVLVVGVS